MITSRVPALVGPGHTPLTPDMSEEFPVLIEYMGVASKEWEGQSDETKERANGPERREEGD